MDERETQEIGNAPDGAALAFQQAPTADGKERVAKDLAHVNTRSATIYPALVSIELLDSISHRGTTEAMHDVWGSWNHTNGGAV